jgi:hypothetical protein
MFLINCTRPDITYTVNKLSRYTSNTGNDHWKATIRVFNYLWYTLTYGLQYTIYLVVLEGYSDANRISNIKDSKSTSEFIFTIRGTAVSWKSFKQTCIAKSTIESKFIALDKVREKA